MEKGIDEITPIAFNRNSKLRKSFRIRQRNVNIPPAAIIYMKKLEKTTFCVDRVNLQIPVNKKCIKKHDIGPQFSSETIDYDENIIDIDDNVPLVRKSSFKGKRKVLKKMRTKHKKLNQIISFFKI
jgi:hypothetical protein